MRFAPTVFGTKQVFLSNYSIRLVWGQYIFYRYSADFYKILFYSVKLLCILLFLLRSGCRYFISMATRCIDTINGVMSIVLCHDYYMVVVVCSFTDPVEVLLFELR